MAKLLEFIFEKVGGRVLLGAGVFAAVFAAWQGDRWNQRRIGGNDAENRIDRGAGEIAARGEAARAAVPADGDNARRLRERFCRDC